LVGWWWCTTGSGSLSQLCRREFVFLFSLLNNNEQNEVFVVFCAGVFFSLWDGVQLVLLSSRSIIQPTQQSRYMYEFISKEEEEEEEQGQQEIIIK
jgi:hypothetical protein